MKILAAALLISPLLFSVASRAASCPDISSQEKVGLEFVLQVANAALPGVQGTDFNVSNEKETSLQSKWDQYWYDGQPDYLTFDIIVGKKTAPGSRFPYSPAVAYIVKVDTNCKASTILAYTID